MRTKSVAGLQPQNSVLLMLLQFDNILERFRSLERETVNGRLLSEVSVFYIPRFEIFFISIRQQVLLPVFCLTFLIPVSRGVLFCRSNPIFDASVNLNWAAIKNKTVLASVDCMFCFGDEISSQRLVELGYCTR